MLFLISKLNSVCSHLPVHVRTKTIDIGMLNSCSRVPWMMTKITLSLWSSAIDDALPWLLLIAFEGSEKPLRVIILDDLYSITVVARWSTYCLLGVVEGHEPQVQSQAPSASWQGSLLGWPFAQASEQKLWLFLNTADEPLTSQLQLGQAHFTTAVVINLLNLSYS